MDQDNVKEFAGEEDGVDRVSAAHSLAEYAWGIIANAGGGDWTTQTDDWQKAAAKWRDQYHDYLRIFTGQETDEAAEIADMERLA